MSAASQLTAPLILPPDVVFLQVADLPPDVRRQITCGDDDVAVNRPGTRASTQVVDQDTVDLLRLFTQPCTLVEAVATFSRQRGSDAEATLEAAFPLLQAFLSSSVLVPQGAAAVLELGPSLEPGDRVEDFEVTRCVQSLEDTEVFEARGSDGRSVALKLSRQAPPSPYVGFLFEREAAALEHLASASVPRLVAHGQLDGRPYLAGEWIPGPTVDVRAAELRQKPAESRRAALLALCQEVIAAYVCLHEAGVLHGDVHLRNLVCRDVGEVVVLDLGLARVLGHPELESAPRAGVNTFFEPEFAAAMLAGQPQPTTTPAGEQYAVGALLYHLVTGSPYLDFPFEKDAFYRRIVADLPITFADRDLAPWPELEAVLRRTLAKEPASRFPSMAALGRALAEVPATPPADEPVAEATAVRSDSADPVRAWLSQLGEDCPWLRDGLPVAPTASLNCGAAGIAYAMYRLSQLRDEPRLLALADRWSERAWHDRELPQAFVQPAMGMTESNICAASTWNGVAGVHAVRAFVAHGRADGPVWRAALADFLGAAAQKGGGPFAAFDVTLGRAGGLLTAATLLDALRSGHPDLDALRCFGDDTVTEQWASLAELPPIVEAPWRTLGAAHGWAGLLYASLIWSEVRGAPPPAELAERLEQLAELAEPTDQGMRWPVSLGPEAQASGKPYWPGWCNGSAGFVFLWTAAYRTFGDEHFAELARGAAEDAWRSPETSASLCCGAVGRAHALLHLHRQGGGERWLERARRLAETAQAGTWPLPQYGHSLYQGEAGLALLKASLARVDEATMPWFEPEGWDKAAEV